MKVKNISAQFQNMPERKRTYERFDINQNKHVECTQDQASEFAIRLREQIIENDRRRK